MVKFYRKDSFVLFLLLVLVLLVSCTQPTRDKENNGNPVNNSNIEEGMDEQYQAALQQHMTELRQMGDRNQEMMRLYEEKEEIEWLIGTWEWSGVIYGNRVWNRLSISEDYIVSSTANGILDQGSYRIDLENNMIYFGNYSYAKIDNYRKIIYAEEGEPYRKISNSPIYSNPSNSFHSESNISGSYGSRNGNNYSIVRFYSDADVIAYTSSHTFRNNNGNKIKITFQGLYSNGDLVTNAPRVVNCSGSSATIIVSSPYNGGGAMYLQVDASRGTITDGSGVVFRMVD